MYQSNTISRRNLLSIGLVAALLVTAVMSLSAGKAHANITVCHAWQQPSWGRARDCATDNTRSVAQYQDMLADSRCVNMQHYGLGPWRALHGSTLEFGDLTLTSPASCAGSTPGVLGPLRTVYSVDAGNWRLLSTNGSFTTVCVAPYPGAPDFPSGKPLCFSEQ